LSWGFADPVVRYGWRPAAPPAEAIPGAIETRLLTLCRSIRLLALLARGDAANDLYVLFLHRTGHQTGPSCRGAANPDGGWVIQQARNLLLALGEQGRQLCFPCPRP
jgi:hypothetical protein